MTGSPGGPSRLRRYVQPSLFAADVEAVDELGFYELARNWALGAALAEALASALPAGQSGPSAVGQGHRAAEATAGRTADRRAVSSPGPARRRHPGHRGGPGLADPVLHRAGTWLTDNCGALVMNYQSFVARLAESLPEGTRMVILAVARLRCSGRTPRSCVSSAAGLASTWAWWTFTALSYGSKVRMSRLAA